MANRHTYTVSIYGTCGAGKDAPEVLAKVRKSKEYQTNQALPSNIKSLIRQATIMAEAQCEAIDDRKKLRVTEIRSNSRIDPV